ncbi:MAG TPA: type II secretion system F family protein [Oscillospiraceae bacterium]|nr:type II secretion system F family protein [Oscillospiraceae bacterium]
MPEFMYVAVSRKGDESKGMVEAESRDRAAADLKNRGLVLISLEEPSALSRDVTFSIFQKKPKARDLSVFCRQFVSILDAGVSVISALEMLSEETENKNLRAAIVEAKRSIEKGESLTEAMRPYENLFGGIFITLLAAGEASGSLDVSLSRMAEQYEKEARLKAMVKKAMIYPVAVAVVALAVIIALLTFVVPTFESMFADLGTQLPALTRGVIAVSRFVIGRWYVIVAVVAVAVFALRSYGKTENGAHLYGRIGLKAPLFGQLTVKSSAARMGRTLSTLIAAGIPFIDAITITADTMTNIYFKEAMEDAREDVSMGSVLSEPIAKSGVFPPLVHHMLKIGEESGNIDGMLTKMADYYDEEVEGLTQRLTAAMEPLIIVLLAAIVGTIVISLVLAMAQMYAGLDSL